MDKLPLHDQISFINNAEVVLSQGGAAITNLMFAGQQTRLIGLVGPTLNQKDYWSNYLDVFKVEHEFIIGDIRNSRAAETVHSDFLISIPDLRNILSKYEITA
jgi:capsular polysaccharide biosynthesis protein